VAFPDEYPFRPFSLRLLTPLYHPTVGPAGVVAVLGHDPYHLLSSFTCSLSLSRLRLS
jgi:ubiquitin-protein ligase